MSKGGGGCWNCICPRGIQRGVWAASVSHCSRCETQGRLVNYTVSNINLECIRCKVSRLLLSAESSSLGEELPRQSLEVRRQQAPCSCPGSLAAKRDASRVIPRTSLPRCGAATTTTRHHSQRNTSRHTARCRPPGNRLAALRCAIPDRLPAATTTSPIAFNPTDNQPLIAADKLGASRELRRAKQRATDDDDSPSNAPHYQPTPTILQQDPNNHPPVSQNPNNKRRKKDGLRTLPILPPRTRPLPPLQHHRLPTHLPR